MFRGGALLIARPGWWDCSVVRPPNAEGVRGLALRILVAGDNEFNRDLLEYMLAGQWLSAIMVVDGREALGLLERERFDLLLLDIHTQILWHAFGVLDGCGQPGGRSGRRRGQHPA